ncbi:MAG: hypothetical protein A4E53_03871 [Pelotomaculum sp. PtaB.Bin104]|nr:MAG: hypothetical protein A4E53_03871 [Pelotomaculum sp. PtaB.Bin104]
MSCKNCACPAWEWNMDSKLPQARIKVCPVCGRIGMVVTSRCVNCQLDSCHELENEDLVVDWVLVSQDTEIKLYNNNL